jgi:hypothetical protein
MRYKTNNLAFFINLTEDMDLQLLPQLTLIYWLLLSLNSIIFLKMAVWLFWMIKDNYYKNWNFLNAGHRLVEFSFQGKQKRISIFWLQKTVGGKVAISLSSKLKKENDRISYHLKNSLIPFTNDLNSFFCKSLLRLIFISRVNLCFFLLKINWFFNKIKKEGNFYLIR